MATYFGLLALSRRHIFIMYGTYATFMSFV